MVHMLFKIVFLQKSQKMRMPKIIQFPTSFFYLFILIFLSFVACTPRAEMNYMKDVESTVDKVSAETANSAIQAGDQLSITITAEDMEAVSPFNQNFTSVANNTNSVTGSNVSNNQTNTSQFPTYVVATDGTINYPVIGKIQVAGKTINNFTDDLTQRISQYVINPVVNVKYTNYKVTVLGQVNKPGTYTVPDGQATLLSALGLAGDLTIYGLRNNILLVRNENGNITKTNIDITKSDFFNSPHYHLKQNDVIYVSSNETVGRQSRRNPNASLYLSMASIVVSILVLIFR